MTPRIVVLSAPSGGGKTTIAKAVRDRYPDRFGFSVSATTRKPRAGERDGVDYHFWTKQQFRDAVAAGKFLEHAEYADELYGTLKDEIERIRRTGRHVLLDIEVEGAEQIKRLENDAVRLFILPSVPQIWIDRLLGRRSESPMQIRRRLERAVEELKKGAHFDRIITNDVLEDAVAEVLRAVAEGDSDSNQGRTTAGTERFSQYGTFLRNRIQELNNAIHSSKG